MKPLLILLDPGYLSQQYTYYDPFIVMFKAMGIPVVTRSLAETASLVPSDYSAAFLPWTSTSSAQAANLGIWITDNTEIPLVMWSNATTDFIKSTATCPTGASGITLDYQQSLGNEKLTDAAGNAYYSEASYLWRSFYKLALDTGYTAVWWGDGGTNNGRPVAWKTGLGAATRYFSVWYSPLHTLLLILNALTDAGVTPDPFKLYINLDDTQMMRDAIPLSAGTSDCALTGMDQIVTWLRAHNTYMVMGQSENPVSAQWPATSAETAAAWVAANPLLTAKFVAAKDVLKLTVHAHETPYWYTDTGLWDTVDKKIAAYDKKIAEFIAAGLPIAGWHYKGFVFTPLNKVSLMGRKAMLKAGITRIREFSNSTDVTNSYVGRTALHHREDGVGSWYGESIISDGLFATITAVPKPYAIVDIRTQAWLAAGATGGNANADYYAMKCQVQAYAAIYQDRHVPWTHSFQAFKETSQPVLLDTLDAYDNIVQASAGWIAWATPEDDYRYIHKKSRLEPLASDATVEYDAAATEFAVVANLSGGGYQWNGTADALPASYSDEAGSYQTSDPLELSALDLTTDTDLAAAVAAGKLVETITIRPLFSDSAAPEGDGSAISIRLVDAANNLVAGTEETVSNEYFFSPTIWLIVFSPTALLASELADVRLRCIVGNLGSPSTVTLTSCEVVVRWVD